MNMFSFNDDGNKNNNSGIDAAFNCGPIEARFNSSNDIIGGVLAGGLVAAITVGIVLFFSNK